ncbi:DUF4332 domain-containing protein [Candidatus Woesearchaeota archaeon]|nr:DUF4332 domain-containing protein [Candidatus Woesearchaeota archaeon]
MRAGFLPATPAIMLGAIIFITLFTFFSVPVGAIADTTRPTIIMVSPENNQVTIGTHDAVTVRFSEQMDPSTINENTFTVFQRTTPKAGSPSTAYRTRQIAGVISYDGVTATATFTPKDPSLSDPSYNPMQPNQIYGNVFTASITSGVKDIAGNSISRDFMWSFTTGGDWFNTGASTSQSNQSSAAVIIPASTAPPTQAPTTLPPATASNTSWIWWTLGGLAAVIMAALIYAFATRSDKKSVRQKDSLTKRTNKRSDFGSTHLVMDLEGIGPKYSKALQTIGILDTYQLWKANPVNVSHKTGAPLTTVKSWQNMAELASINGIGPQYAELLERSGIHSIDQLKSYNANKLLNLVQQKQDSLNINIQGNTPGIPLVENWIDQAREHKFSAQERQTA